MARNGRSGLARSRSWHEIAARAWPKAAAGSKWRAGAQATKNIHEELVGGGAVLCSGMQPAIERIVSICFAFPMS